ncbi:hypothetical protein SASPL_147205 [Salvia splendens]|uniref:Thiaminase-2/PQQC domain-containing protein n=1 Tax=Salvia splendens TaxID=180675 RepID=A0A8X8WE72_SALSN|nr:probable bifunctional TENA-E protein [Salvia splendens]KAG6392975.1 hypothetical protein SASPL_147205 [Salvia splendens]
MEITETWLRKHRPIYLRATQHPFILSIRDASLPLSSFKRWLGQDYIFVRAFVPFIASLLVKAWKEGDDEANVDIILSGIATLNDEVSWFKREASKWGVSLDGIVPQPANLVYCSFLECLMSAQVDYTQAVTAFWAIEAVYQESFAHCLEDGCKTRDELKETCERWGNDSFGQYCRALQGIANRQLEKASDQVVAKAEALFVRVLELEVEFWNMSVLGS